MGKNVVKGATQVNGHLWKLHFWMFEKSQVKHNNLNCHNFFEIFSINCKDYMLKTWRKSKMFLHVQSIQTLRMDNFCFFFKWTFFLPNVHHFFWKSKRILTLMIKIEKRWTDGFFKKINLSTFSSKMILTLKIMDFENVPLINVIHVYVIEGMNAEYTLYKINFLFKCIYI